MLRDVCICAAPICCVCLRVYCVHYILRDVCSICAACAGYMQRGIYRRAGYMQRSICRRAGYIPRRLFTSAVMT